jgi:small-conductance mechanosensitive channel
MSNWQNLIDTQKLKLMVIDNLTDQWASILSVLPNVIGALVIMLIGWLIAIFIKKMSVSMLAKMGFDRLSNESGVLSMMDNAGITQKPSNIVGKIFFWLILFLFMVPAADTLDFKDLVLLIKSIISYLPKLMIAITVLVLGAMFAKFIRDTVANNRVFSNISAGGSIANTLYFVILASIVLMALEQLNINTQLLYSILLIVLSGTVLALAISVGLGAKEVAKNILTGSYARESFTPGSIVEIGELQGEIISVGAVNTLLKLSESDSLSIPNETLFKSNVVIKGGK